MKKLLTVLLAVLIVFTLVSCSNNDNETQNEMKEPETQEETSQETASGKETENSESKILIVYFSWSNNTEVIANYIHDEIGGDIERIEPVVAYPDNYNDTADYAKAERDNDARPEFKPLQHDPTDYDVVFIGYPIWWYRMPMIMETFFDTYDFSGITIVPFNTHEGSRDGGTYDMIRDREPNATVLEGLPIRGGNVNDAASRKAVTDWLKGLKLE